MTPQETVTISITVDELDILSLTVGQDVTLYLDALKGKHFAGTITEIDPEGVNSGGNTKYTVTVATERTASMLPGMNVTVVLPGETHENVPVIPLAALNEDGNNITVYTAYDAETDTLLNPVEVKTGLSDGTNVEIISGLSAGDTYYYRYAEAIEYTTNQE